MSNYSAKYYQTHKEERKASSAEYSRQHPKQCNQYKKKWKENNKEYFEKYYEEHKKEHRQYQDKTMKHLKINGCAVCGYDSCNDALSFHHVNPEDKKFNINPITTEFGAKKLIDELNKCILLCCRCHREIHFKEREIE